MKTCPILLRIVIALFLIAPGAGGEVNMALTISGYADELLAIIQHLRELGYGTGEFDGNDPLKLRMNSVESEGAEVPAPAPTPALVLGNPMISPATAAPGERLYLTVEALDDLHVIDTIAGRYMDRAVDLFDNGMHGDAIAGDGIWSAEIFLPAEAIAGDYLVQIIAYDAKGLALADPFDETRALSAEIGFTVAVR